MSSQRLCSMLLLCLLFCAPRAHALTGARSAAPLPDERRETLKPASSKALAALDEVLKEAEGLKLPENRAWVQAQAASLLWRTDEKRARRLFGESLAALEGIESDPDDDAPDESLRQMSVEMRHEVLQLIGELDFQLAAEYLRRSNPAASPDEEYQLSLEVAARVADEDPQRALRLAQESLSRKVSYKLVELVAQLRGTDPAAAAKLAGDITAKLKSEDFTTNREAAAVACGLLRIALDSPDATGGGSPGAHPMLDQHDSKALMELTAAAALRTSDGQPELLLGLQSLLPAMENVVPSLASRLRRRTDLLVGYARETNGGNEDTASRIAPDGQTTFAGSRSREEQTADLIAGAEEAAGKGDKTRALQLLDEASNLAGVFSRAKDSSQLAAQLEVARAYLSLAPDRSLAIIEAMTDQLDELASATLAVNGFLLDSHERFARRSELNLRTIHVFLQSHHYDELLHSVARANFDGLQNALAGFQHPEVRVIARLIIVGSALSQKAVSQE
ncbi:MAG: hypothetical protein QOJ76_3182 [Acidobacteriota bacterium]|nr:hypothetical protein [Acidobacteriota bacterium]